MPYSSVLGHTEIIANLRSMVESGRMPHALLFTEKAGYGALPLALATLNHMFGGSTKVTRLVHPDIHFTFPINTSTLIGGDKRGELEQFYPIWRELVLKNPYFSETQLYKAFGIENKLGTISVAEANSIIKKLSLSSYELSGSIECFKHFGNLFGFDFIEFYFIYYDYFVISTFCAESRNHSELFKLFIYRISVISGLGTECNTTLNPLCSTDRTLSCTTCTFLSPWFDTAAAYF